MKALKVLIWFVWVALVLFKAISISVMIFLSDCIKVGIGLAREIVLSSSLNTFRMPCIIAASDKNSGVHSGWILGKDAVAG